MSSAIRRAMPGRIPKMMAGMGTLANANALGSDIRRPHPVASCASKPPESAAPSGEQGQPHCPAIRWTVPVPTPNC